MVWPEFEQRHEAGADDSLGRSMVAEPESNPAGTDLYSGRDDPRAARLIRIPLILHKSSRYYQLLTRSSVDSGSAAVLETDAIRPNTGPSKHRCGGAVDV
jgi:hypothetical protein